MTVLDAARRLGLALWLASGLLPRSVSAAPPSEPLQLAWRAPAGCPDREAALAQLRILLHGDYSGPRAEARVVIAAAGAGGFVVTTQTRLGAFQSERRFAGVTCEALARATTLIIAMTLDPVGAAGAAVTPPAASRPEPTRLLPRPRVLPGRELELALGARVTGDAGSLPLPTLGVGVAFDARYRRLLAEISMTLFLSRRVTREPTPGAGGVIGLRTAAARWCFAPLSSLSSWYACLGSELGVTDGQGVGIRHPQRSSDVWIAAFAGAALRRRIGGPLHVWTNMDFAVPLRIPSYAIEGYGEVDRPWTVVTRGALGVDVTFW